MGAALVFVIKMNYDIILLKYSLIVNKLKNIKEWLESIALL